MLKEGLEGLGGLHWSLAILSLAGWAIDNYETNTENKEDLSVLLKDIIEIIKDYVITIWDATRSHEQKMIHILQETDVVAFECATYSLTLMEQYKQSWKKLLL